MANDTPFTLLIDALKSWEDFTIFRRDKSLRGSVKSPGRERHLFSRNPTCHDSSSHLMCQCVFGTDFYTFHKENEEV
jgi:hypothetical protein